MEREAQQDSRLMRAAGRCRPGERLARSRGGRRRGRGGCGGWQRSAARRLSAEIVSQGSTSSLTSKESGGAADRDSRGRKALLRAARGLAVQVGVCAACKVCRAARAMVHRHRRPKTTQRQPRPAPCPGPARSGAGGGFGRTVRSTLRRPYACGGRRDTSGRNDLSVLRLDGVPDPCRGPGGSGAPGATRPSQPPEAEVVARAPNELWS